MSEPEIEPETWPPAKPALKVAAWHYPTFRRIWFGQLVSDIGTGGQKTALAWMALSAGNVWVGAAVAVGIVGGSRFVPMVLAGTRAGRWIDSHPNPARVLANTQWVVAGISAVLILLLLTGNQDLWILLAVSLVSGIALVVEPPALAVLAQQAVPDQIRGNAIASMGLLYDVAKIIVPALAGTLIIFGAAPALVVFNCVSCVVFALMVRKYEPYRGVDGAPEPLPKPTVAVVPAEDLPVDVAGARLRRQIIWVTIAALPALELATFLPLLAVLDGSAGADFRFGVIAAVAGFGSLAAGLLCARFLHVGGRSKVIRWLGVYVIALIAAGAAAAGQWFLGVLVAVAVASALLSVVLAVLGVTVLTSARPHERGKVASVWALTVTGGTVLSAPTVGLLVAFLGVGAALLAAALVAAAALLRLALRPDPQAERATQPRFVPSVS